jgi:hypothetical protein
LIVSHKHKFIFLKTHKTGGTSLQIALSSHCGAEDIISRLHPDDTKDLIRANGKGEQNTTVPFKYYNKRDWFQFILRGRKQHYSEHIGVNYLKRWIEKDVWDTYYKFCFERNPFEKVLSYYYWRARGSNITLEEFMAENLPQLSDMEIYTNKGTVIVDDIFQYENIDYAISQLENRFGFSIPIKSIKAKTGYRKDRKPYNEVFTNKQLTKIATAFKFEINNLYPELTKYL